MKAVICDLDGTLALLTTRKPYGEDQGRCEEDTLCTTVSDILKAMFASGYHIVLVSGRFDTYEQQTEKWLQKYSIPYSGLFLRRANDQRSDDIIKEELYREHIEPFYDVQFVIDDRPKVIRMWKALGFKVLDMGNGVEF